jgi:conjugal transfer pilus assembly protein TraW
MNKRALLILMLCPLLPLNAASLGAVGQVFPISEIDMLQWIEHRLHTFEQKGELQSMREQFQDNVKAGVRRPRPVGLITTLTPEVFNVDPTLTLAKDIKDLDGNLIYAKGTRVNPFDTATWPALQKANVGQFKFSKTLVFFDGDDVQQVLWAKEFATTHDNPHNIKWILTGGEPETLHHQLQARIYFDQQGNISRALTIKRVPSVVKQAGVMWQVREVDVSDFPVFMEEVNHDAP